MSNVWRIFRDDLRLATSNIVSLLVVLGLCLVPVMYAWFNIAGSWDPYGNTGKLKVAVANGDEGYESDLISVKLNIGDRVVDMLHENDDYGWVFVDEDAALDGVRSGEYYAAIVMPADFSAKLMSVLSSDAEQVSIDYYLNMKENPVASVLAGEGEAEVVEDIRVKFTEAVDKMSLGLLTDFISTANSGNLKGYGARLMSRLGDLADDLDAAAGQLRTFSDLADATSALASSTAAGLSGSGEAADASGGVVGKATEALNAAVSSAQSAVSGIEQQVQAAASESKLDGVGTETASKLAGDVSSLVSSVSEIARQADAVAKSLQDTATSLAGSTDSVSSSIEDVKTELDAAADKLADSASNVRKFQNDVATAVSQGNFDTIADIVGGNADSLADWLADPVRIEKHAVYPVENYGSSMAPFYTILSIWVGAVVLVAIMKTGVSEGRIRRYEEEAGRPVRPSELYLGRYLVFALLTVLQATVVCLGDLFFLQIQCVHPLLFLGACWVCALVFSNIVYTFAVSFGEIGKALCIILLVMQVAGSGGEYPIQMMGDFFQAVYPFLPFTHGMHAMQASIAGVYGMEYAYDLLRVCAFLLPSLFLGLVIRRPIVRFMRFFDSKLGETGLM